MEKRFEIGKPSKKQKVWKGKRGKIKISEMDNDHLQRALIYAQHKELMYHNKSALFSQKIEDLLEEAKSRGIELKELDDVREMGSFFENKRRLKSKKDNGR